MVALRLLFIWHQADRTETVTVDASDESHDTSVISQLFALSHVNEPRTVLRSQQIEL